MPVPPDTIIFWRRGATVLAGTVRMWNGFLFTLICNRLCHHSLQYILPVLVKLWRQREIRTLIPLRHGILICPESNLFLQQFRTLTGPFLISRIDMLPDLRVVQRRQTGISARRLLLLTQPPDGFVSV